MNVLEEALDSVARSTLDVLPIILFLFAFQWIVFRRKLENQLRVMAGLVFVIIGLGLFLVGLEQTLFPLGRLMAEQLTHPDFLAETNAGTTATPSWRDFYWVYLFAAAIGFSAVLAEPALIAVAMKANAVSGGAIRVLSLRVAVAVGVAVGVSLGCYRIIVGLPLHWFIGACYVVVIAQTIAAPRLIVPLAYDSGGVTTSTVTVPLVTALGLGLADSVAGRSPLIDGFGLVAIACLFPIISVLAYGQLAALYEKFRRPRPP